ncbi:hypothetical protein L1887_17883 [Cichorium endivia]|nr:hypothetical protein L1887_17883 [Cichorium endivia]
MAIGAMWKTAMVSSLDGGWVKVEASKLKSSWNGKSGNDVSRPEDGMFKNVSEAEVMGGTGVDEVFGGEGGGTSDEVVWIVVVCGAVVGGGGGVGVWLFLVEMVDFWNVEGYVVLFHGWGMIGVPPLRLLGWLQRFVSLTPKTHP